MKKALIHIFKFELLPTIVVLLVVITIVATIITKGTSHETNETDYCYDCEAFGSDHLHPYIGISIGMAFVLFIIACIRYTDEPQ